MNMLSLRRAAAAALVAVWAGATPALAAPISDGTSNTIQLAVTAHALDEAHHRVLVNAPNAAAVLRPGQHLGRVQLVSERLAYTFEDVMVESLTGTSTRLSLNFTEIKIGAGGHGCPADVNVCLM